MKLTQEMMPQIVSKLSEKMPFKWRVGQTNSDKTKCSVLAYIDARDVMDRLDQVAGPGNWQREYRDVKNNLFCGVGLLIDGEWVYKWDCGSESNIEAEKGESSDAFKRAAVNWGIGRFLYDMDTPWFKFDGRNIIDDKGQKVWNVTEHVNNTLGKKSAPAKAPAGPKTEKVTVKAEVSPVLSHDYDKEMKEIMPAYKEALAKLSEDKQVAVKAIIKGYYEANNLEMVIKEMRKIIS